jgi:hypothetical protein
LHLGYLTPAELTNPIEVTSARGVLSTQFLVHVLNEDGVVEPGEVDGRLVTKGDALREFLAGDVLEVIRHFFACRGCRFYAALYELEDEELQVLLEKNARRLSLILSDSGSQDGEEAGSADATYDTRNAPARKALRRLFKTTKGFDMQDRMFNGSGQDVGIGVGPGLGPIQRLACQAPALAN